MLNHFNRVFFRNDRLFWTHLKLTSSIFIWNPIGELYSYTLHLHSPPTPWRKCLGESRLGDEQSSPVMDSSKNFFSAPFSKTTLSWSSGKVAVKWRKRLGRRLKMIMSQPLKKKYFVFAWDFVYFSSMCLVFFPPLCEIFFKLHYYCSFGYSFYSGLMDLNGTDSLRKENPCSYSYVWI